MKTITVGPRDRARLKNFSKKIFRRLIMDKEAERIGGRHSAGLVIVVGAYCAVIVALLFYLGAVGSGLSARVAEYIPENFGISQDYVSSALLVLIGLALLAPVAFFWSSLSTFSYDFIGWMLVQQRRISSDASRQTNLADVKYWLRTDPEKVPTECRDYLGKPANELLPAKVRAALEGLNSPGSGPTWLVVHGLLEKKYWLQYLLSGYRTQRPDQKYGGDNANYFILARMLRNAIKISMCFDALNVELRDEAANGSEWCWDYYSKTDYQHVPTWDSHDLPLRFRTATPHLRWPNPKDPSSDGELPLIRALTGLENPLGFSAQLLSARDVVNQMVDITPTFFPDCAGEDEDTIARRRARAAKYLCILANRSVKLIGRYDYHTMQALMGRDSTDRPLLQRLDGAPAHIDDHDPDEILSADWGIRWDPNRIVWSELKPTSDGELLLALALFMDATNEAMRSRATPVRLKRGSVLFADNQRCLIGRFERRITKVNSLKNLFLNQPGEWWIRRFYGFRKSRPNDWSQNEIGQRFDAGNT